MALYGIRDRRTGALLMASFGEMRSPAHHTTGYNLATGDSDDRLVFVTNDKSFVERLLADGRAHSGFDVCLSRILDGSGVAAVLSDLETVVMEVPVAQVTPSRQTASASMDDKAGRLARAAEAIVEACGLPAEQRMALDGLMQHDKWYPGCGWGGDAKAMQRTMRALTKRGFVEGYDEEIWSGQVAAWRPTAAGMEEAGRD